jgi:glycosyltransferase involved in cell wall biosynthesis
MAPEHDRRLQLNRSATVVITTKNRKEDLAGAIASALAQTAPLEILVIDDGSTDGTAEMVRTQFPTVKLDRSEQSAGLIVQRNRAAKLAATEFIFSIDDDAVFSTPNTVAQTLAEFDDDRIGAVAIPFIDVKKGPQVHQLAPDGGVYAAYTYVGTAHAIRREMFIRLGGYREYLFHQGEERDLAIRMLAAGFIVRLGRADPIHHFESPRRDFRRMDLYGRRNDILYAWYNVPMPYFPVHLLATTLNGFKEGWRWKRMAQMTRGIFNGYAAIFDQLGARRPVSGATYRLSRSLNKRHGMPLGEIESALGESADRR